MQASNIGRNLRKSGPLPTWPEKWRLRYVELSRGGVQGHTQMPLRSIRLHFYFMSPRKVSLEYTESDNGLPLVDCISKLVCKL
jgi:hypothetical protein